MLTSIKTHSLTNEGQKLGMMYFRVAIILFGAQLLMGLIAAIQFLAPSFLFELFDFSVARMVHINALVVWMLYAMIGSVYLLLTDETEHQGVAIGLGKLGFWVLTAAVAVVVLVYIFVQVGAGTETTLWLINEGREYIEAPRWADIGIVVVVLIFYWNVFATYMAGKKTGIMTVMVANLLALAGLYIAGMVYTDNISMDQFWWWWVIHLWVEATWEVFVGTLAAYALIKLIGAKREIVEMWLWIEVLMLFGSGILGLGHHYFWIGTPEYWWEIGALFSALEPVPLVAMFVHVLYDWGKEQGIAQGKGEEGTVIANGPAMAWIVTNAFGNFLGAGIWGFFHTLPQVNIYTHGSQFTAAHGHLAFFGAYATILIGMMYYGIQRAYGVERMRATFKSKMGIFLITFGVVGMTVALTIAGYEQVLVERAELGATWNAFFVAQNLPWYVQAQIWRTIMGVVTFAGFVFLVLDFLTIGAKAKEAESQ
jgi:nitric oxide reductase subunit B